MADSFEKYPEDLRLAMAEANEAEERRTDDVHFTLPPFEAGMLLGIIARDLERESLIDRPSDPLRRVALENCYAILTQQLSDWQKGRADA